MIPDAILSRIARLFLLLSAALVFGIIYGIATHDRILLLLSIALAVTGGIKIALLFLSARKKEYEIVEGTVTSIRRNPVRKCQVLKITNDAGAEAEILVKGRHEESGPELEAFRKVLNGKDKTWQECPFEVGVDSGQAGIFDDKHYQDNSVFDGMPAAEFDPDNSWYSHCCDITMSPLGAGVLPFGVVSSSGYGDGGYAALKHIGQDGRTDSVFIVFLDD